MRRNAYIILIILVIPILCCDYGVSDYHSNIVPGEHNISIVQSYGEADADTTYRPMGSLREHQNYSLFYVPHYYQERSYSCGEASLRMLFAYWGLYVSEELIGAVANWDPKYGTYNTDLLRAAHFSFLSTAIQNSSLRGYPHRKIGFPAFQAWYMTIEDLKHLVDEGIPILVLTSYDYGHYGHFRVVKGYDDQNKRIILHDPWYSKMPYAGPNIFIDYDKFYDLWEYSSYWGMAIVPWKIDYTIEGLAPNSAFTLRVNITYYVPQPFDPQSFPACNATLNITVPDGYSVLAGDSIVFDDVFEGGESKTIEIQIQAPSEIEENDTITLMAYGRITGTSYSYSYYEDYIGWIEHINLIDYTEPQILGISYNASFGPFKLNISLDFFDESDVTIDILYNVMNKNQRYELKRLIVLGNHAFANITLTKGNIDLEFAIRIMDIYGNSIFSRSIMLHISDEPPYIRLEQHVLRLNYEVDSITVRWDIYDDFEVKYIMIYVDDSLVASIKGLREEYNISVEEGIHTVYVEAVDTSYQESRDSMTLYYDYHPPTVSMNLNNGSVVPEFVSLEFRAEDNVLLNRTILIFDGQKIAETNGTLKYSGFIAPGSHVVEVYAVDFMGNVARIRITIVSLPIITIAIIIAITATIVLLRRKMH